RTLSEVVDEWLTTVAGSVAETTYQLFEIHLNHFKKVTGPKYPVADITHEKLQAYVKKRCETVASATAKKEINTFGQLWRFCKKRNIVSGEPPWHSLRYPVHSGKPPFRTWTELEVMENPEWESLYLD